MKSNGSSSELAKGLHNIKNVPSFLLYFAILSLVYGSHPQDYLVTVGWLLQLQTSHLHFRQEEE